MYSQLGAFIKVGNRVYDWIDDDCGTSQGGPLSPNLFRLMLCDLGKYLTQDHGIVLHNEVISHLL